MKVLFVFSIAALTQITFGQEAKSVEGVGFMSHGYDIFKGNPISYETTRDPGFADKIFEFTFDLKAMSEDGRINLPDKVEGQKVEGCSMKRTSSIINDMSTYTKTLKTEVTLSGGITALDFGASFSASTGYHSTFTETQKKGMSIILSLAKCEVYHLDLDQNDLPKFKIGFIKKLKSLPDQFDETYLEFVEQYGTHYIDRMSLGSRYGYQCSIKTSSLKRAESQGVDVTLSADYKAAKTIGVKSTTNTSSSKEIDFSSEFTDEKVISLGGKIPEKANDVSSWLTNTISNPMPVGYTLRPIWELIKDADLSKYEIRNKEKLVSNLKQASTSRYCNYLKGKGLIHVPCDGEMVDASCTFCTSCGGAYTEYGGSIDRDSDWYKWSKVRGESCSGNLESRKKNNKEGIKLCCQKNQSKLKSQCRLCTSCGAEYSQEGGAIMSDRNWPKWNEAYGNSCGGIPSGQNPELKLCCLAGSPGCSLCSSCGDKFINEQTKLSTDRCWKNFFRIKGNNCLGPLENREYCGKGMADSVSLCCATTVSKKKFKK